MRLLLTGDYGAAEFSAAVAEIRAACDYIEEPRPERAAGMLQAAETSADLIVVAQSRPGQFAEAEIESLRRAAPLSPLVAMLGSWCEGEPRSGSPWPGVVRVYWHQWPMQFSCELARLAQGQSGAWSQPATATLEERLLLASGAAGKAFKGSIAVVSDCHEMADWLSSACRAMGTATIVFHAAPAAPVKGIQAVLWDAGLARRTLIEDFRRLAMSFFDARLIVMIDFPRSSDALMLVQAGAAAVLAKPIMLADLRCCLERAVGD